MLKRTLEEDSEAVEEKTAISASHAEKRVKLFSAEEFRSKIHASDTERESALSDFLRVIKDDKESDAAIFEYFQAGGHCLMLFQLWEMESTSFAPILEICQHLILAVLNKYQNMYNSTLEACKYLLNSHLILISKMLQPSAAPKDRRLTVKLLAAMVAFSPSLVKDILLNVRFHVDILNKHSANLAQSTRLAFINFLLAFFIDGHYPTMLQLINKPFFFASIIPGLQYDPAETVQLVLMTLKTQVVENESVPKPVRVKLFTTRVVKGLVHLYNWRGPNCIEEKRQKPIDGEVDSDQSQTIANLAHEVLLELCTSIKYGIIFRDETLGTGVQQRNPVMFGIIDVAFTDNLYNVLHLELCVKMTAECPDMVKSIWAKLHPVLGPRPTKQWIRAVRFMREIINAATPQTVLRVAKNIQPSQFAQVVQILVAPTQLLEVILSSGFQYSALIVKQEVIRLVHVVLKAVNRFVVMTKEALPEAHYRMLRSILMDHLHRNLPNGNDLLHNWTMAVEANEAVSHNLPQYNRMIYMTEVVKVLRLYHKLCPILLNNLKFDYGLVNMQFKESDTEMHQIQVNNFKISFIHLLILLDPRQFHLSGDLFQWSIKITAESLAIQKEAKDEEIIDVRQCISNILELTGLFTNCEYEIPIWIEALKHKHFPEYFCQVLTNAHENTNDLKRELRAMTSAFVEIQDETLLAANKVDEIIESLTEMKNTLAITAKPMKPVLCSTVVITALRTECNKKVKKQLGIAIQQIFHLQTDYRCFQSCVVAHQNNLSDSVVEYIEKWPEAPEYDMGVIVNTQLLAIVETSTALFKLLNLENSTEELTVLVENARKHAGVMLDMIYCHPKLHKKFKLAKMKSSVVDFLTKITEHIQKTKPDLDISCYLRPYQLKLFSFIQTAVRTWSVSMPKTFVDDFSKVIDVFGLAHQDCFQILDNLCERDVSAFLTEERKPNFNYFILVGVLNNLSKIKCKAEYGNIKSLLNILTELNKINLDSSDLAQSMQKYFMLNLGQVTDDNTKDYFVGVVQRAEYCKENALLAIMMFKFTMESKKGRDSALQEAFAGNLGVICEKKGMILPLLDIVVLDNSLSARTFDILTTMLKKLLLKPSKAGQHFENHYEGLCRLIEKHVLNKFVQPYLEKPFKADTTEVFLPAILRAMYIKFFNDTSTNASLEKYANNALITFVQYLVNMLKTFHRKSGDDIEPSDMCKLEKVCAMLVDVSSKIPKSVSTRSTMNNETFKLFSKMCLKHGVGKANIYFLELLRILYKKMQYSLEEARELLEMLLAHSKFMDVALEELSDAKLAVFDFMYDLCKSQPGILEKKHVPLLLASYTATMHPADRRVLSLLRLCETAPEQTMFYSFKPFLWGMAAANFYSVRSDSRKGLWRQPRTRDVLDILQLTMIEATIVNFPLNTSLLGLEIETGLDNEVASRIYDIGFILSVCAQLLSSEHTMITHIFTRSGALSLVVVALASANVNVRTAACHVLAKFFYHLESRRSGRDHLLWIRFVEVVAKGAGRAVEQKLNTFSALFMARTALVLANPTDPMYGHLTNFIGVTVAPCLSKIPELYTFLNSGAVEYEIQRKFILQVLCDGMRTNDDIRVVTASMAFKLIMELFNSVLTDGGTKSLILDIIERAAGLQQGAWTLCTNFGLSSWLFNMMNVNRDALTFNKLRNIYKKIVSHKGLESTTMRITLELEDQCTTQE